MFGTIRKHQRWLWVFIIAAVIISFVLYFSPNQASRAAHAQAVVGQIDGTSIGEADLRSAHQQAQLSGFLRFGENYRSGRAEQMGFNLKQETLQWLFVERRLKDYGIQASDAAVAAWITEYLKDPKTGTVNLEAFLQNAIKPAGFTENQFYDFVRHEVGLQELQRLIGVSGQLVTPQEAEAQFREQNETLSVSLVRFSSSNYLASVTLDNLKLGEFFTNRLAFYRAPERLTLTYVRFEGSNHLAAAEAELAARPNLASELEQVYQQRGADAFRDTSGAVLSKDDALAKIRESSVRSRAAQMATVKANEFANELYQMEPVSAANLATLAEKKGIAVQKTVPFAEGERVIGLEDINPNTIAQGLTRLSPEQPFMTPWTSTRGAVLAAATERTPSFIPTLDSVRPKVENDYKRVQSGNAAKAAGRAFQAAATNALAQGKSFADAAAAASVKTTEFSFTLSSPTIAGLEGDLNPAVVKNAVERLSPGTISEFIPTEDGGFVVTVKERKPVADETVKSALNSFLAQLRQEREQEAFSAWFATEFQKSGAPEIAKRVGL